MAYLKNQGYEIDYVALTETGEVDLAHLQELLRQDTVLVSVCTVDSEIGILQPITKVAQIVSRYPHCVFHTDATQAIGKVPVCLDGIGLATFAPHKFYGLNGSGALIRKEAVQLEPQIHGGISTTPFRSGTPALALAAALQKALLLALQTREKRYKKAAVLNKRLRDFFKQYPGIRINSTCKSVPFILNLSIPGVKTEKIQQQLSEAGIYVATKSACCAPNTVSRPVYALTRDKKAALSTLRISLSHLTTDEELDIFMERFTEIYRTLEKRG
jgi:cysteine desulfurase